MYVIQCAWRPKTKAPHTFEADKFRHYCGQSCIGYAARQRKRDKEFAKKHPNWPPEEVYSVFRAEIVGATKVKPQLRPAEPEAIRCNFCGSFTLGGCDCSSGFL